ncbi:TAXI family TRAP transporter solute-binding subunit [Natrinema soli]|uniref:TAXI family TRAP transporter solute-binding subunit n=1 Tax=Natrinema soli TaxID=1930624 RepID=A0ABD5SJ04_9EURY|nr:TAXI family TRAP transporter solute-binding subunit [Natrinema soli]
MASIGRREYVASAVASGASITLLAGCLGGNSDTTNLTYGAGGSGSGTFAAGQAMQQIARENTDVRITTQETDGTEANLRLWSEGNNIDFFGTSNLAMNLAIDNEEPFADSPMENYPYQGHTYGLNYTYMLAREDTDIETYEDLRGANVWPLWPGSTIRLPVEMILQEAGIWSDMEVINISQSDIAGALEEQRVDAIAVYSSGYTEQLVGWNQEVDARANLRVLEMGDDLQQTIEEMPVPPLGEVGTSGWEQDVGTDTAAAWEMSWQIYYDPDAPADAFTDLVLALSENGDTYRDVSPTGPNFEENTQELTRVLNENIMEECPIHPGAAEAYRELDLWEDDWMVEGE